MLPDVMIRKFFFLDVILWGVMSEMEMNDPLPIKTSNRIKMVFQEERGNFR